MPTNPADEIFEITTTSTSEALNDTLERSMCRSGRRLMVNGRYTALTYRILKGTRERIARSCTSQQTC